MGDADTGHQSLVTGHAFRWSLRMLFWLALIAATAGFFWYMVAQPGASHSGALRDLTADETLLADKLRRHVAVVASLEHNVLNAPAALEAAARHIEFALFSLGYDVGTQRFEVERMEVRNIEVTVGGASRAEEIVVVGAHYDSVG